MKSWDVGEIWKEPRGSPTRLEKRQEQYGPVGVVEVRGEPLTHPLYWIGRQWAVTGYGLEVRDGTYSIPKERLLEDWSLYEHIALKLWVDWDDFAVAFCEAQTLFRKQQEAPAT